MTRLPHPGCRRLAALACSLAAAGLIGTARAEPEADIAGLSLEELLNVEVTTVSRKAQRLTDTAAAAFVITAEDIQRAGVTTVPQALRMVPGVHVARLSASRWAVSARGFNGRFANKLLVLMDGRSVYSPLFSGVFWESEDLLLEDIQRIEVIRGPGAALWGANAVNGVINIITKKASATQGTLVGVRAGIEEVGELALRHGGRLDEGRHYRVWAKGLRRDGSRDEAGRDANDDWSALRAGFRYDQNMSAGDRFSLIGGIGRGESGDVFLVPDLATFSVRATPITQKDFNAHVTGRYEWLLADGTSASVQAYAHQTELQVGNFAHARQNTFDLDFQHGFRASGAHEVVWGAGYRWSRDDIRTAIQLLSIAPQRRDYELWSAFAHDEITLVPERWKAILGAKLEHHSTTGLAFQPNARLLWTPSATETWWVAVSRALRTPSRGERDAQVDLGFVSALPPVLARVLPNRDLDAERLTAYELGYRTQPTARLSLDIAAFYNRYAGLRSGRTIGLDFTNFPLLVAQTQTANTLQADTRGLEIAAEWHPVAWWRLQGAYTYFRMRFDETGDPANDGSGRLYAGTVPRSQLSLRSSIDLGSGAQFDLWLRRTGALPDSGVPAYTAVDLRFAWKPLRNLEIALVGQNVFDPSHKEFVSDFLPTQTLEIQRAAYVKALLQF